MFRVLYHLFDKKFIHDSYSCRFKKGTHRGVLRLEQFIRKVSANYKKPAYALKCDIKKFLHNIDQRVLLQLIEQTVIDSSTIWLVERIIKSFESESNRGLPLGNVTSQLFANIYLNELDQFMKHGLKEKYYLRYCDDFIILGRDKEHLINLIKPINRFLSVRLNLVLHSDKLVVRKLGQGIDFLGYVALPYYKVLRTKTKRRMFKKIIFKKQLLKRGLIIKESFNQSLQSYFGALKHCSSHKIIQEIFQKMKIDK